MNAGQTRSVSKILLKSPFSRRKRMGNELSSYLNLFFLSLFLSLSIIRLNNFFFIHSNQKASGIAKRDTDCKHEKSTRQ